MHTAEWGAGSGPGVNAVGYHLVLNVAPVLAQLYVSQDAVLPVKQEIQEFQAVDRARETGGGSHLGQGGDICEGHAALLLPTTHLHTTLRSILLQFYPGSSPKVGPVAPAYWTSVSKSVFWGQPRDSWGLTANFFKKW